MQHLSAQTVGDVGALTAEVVSDCIFVQLLLPFDESGRLL